MKLPGLILIPTPKKEKYPSQKNSYISRNGTFLPSKKLVKTSKKLCL